MESETNWESLAAVGEFIWGIFGDVRLSFEIPSEWLEEAVDTKRVRDNFQKVDLRTRRVLPKGRLIMNITSPEVIRVEETQMGEVT